MAGLVYSTFKALAEALSPPWLRQAYGAAFVRSIADVKDGQLEAAKDAVKIRFPRHATRDALDALAWERGLERSVADTNATHAERLRNAWDIWSAAGTALGILRALHYLGYTHTLLISERGIVNSLDADTNLVISSTTGSVPWTSLDLGWSRFDVVFPTPHIARWVASGIPATADTSEGRLIIETVKRWKPAFATLERVIIQRTGPMWGFPVGATWGQGGRVWGGGLEPIAWEVRE